MKKIYIRKCTSYSFYVYKSVSISIDSLMISSLKILIRCLLDYKLHQHFNQIWYQWKKWMVSRLLYVIVLTLNFNPRIIKKNIRENKNTWMLIDPQFTNGF